MLSWAAGGSLLVTAVVTLLAFRNYRRRGTVQADGRVVVITGCDSGIGHALALRTRAWGFTVVATCLAPLSAPARELQDAGVIVVQLDLRQMEGVSHLKEVLVRLKEQKKDLWCLVNNAGVLTYAHCEWQTPAILSNQILVNLSGPILLTRDLLPALRRNKGRVVMVSSPTGQAAPPFMSTYSATKFGLEGFSQGLRREVAPFGVSVVVVRPCNLHNRTGILVSNAEQLKIMMRDAAPETREDYGPLIEGMQKGFQETYGDVDEVQDLNDEHLMECFRQAVTSESPDRVYSAAPLIVKVFLSLFQIIPTSWMDLLIRKDFYNTVLGLASTR